MAEHRAYKPYIYMHSVAEIVMQATFIFLHSPAEQTREKWTAVVSGCWCCLLPMWCDDHLLWLLKSLQKSVTTPLNMTNILLFLLSFTLSLSLRLFVAGAGCCTQAWTKPFSSVHILHCSSLYCLVTWKEKWFCPLSVFRQNVMHAVITAQQQQH